MPLRLQEDRYPLAAITALQNDNYEKLKELIVLKHFIFEILVDISVRND
jgi:hypothetical protein